MPDLPDMLRDENPMCERRSATPEEWQANGKWTLYPIGPELAALVEADDKLCARVREVLASDLRIAGDPWCEPALQDEHKGHDYDLTGLLRARDAARAALVAKIGGSNA